MKEDRDDIVGLIEELIESAEFAIKFLKDAKIMVLQRYSTSPKKATKVKRNTKNKKKKKTKKK